MAFFRAFEQPLAAHALKSCDDPATEQTAKKIIKVTAETGERDPGRICSQAVAELVSSHAA